MKTISVCRSYSWSFFFFQEYLHKMYSERFFYKTISLKHDLKTSLCLKSKAHILLFLIHSTCKLFKKTSLDTFITRTREVYIVFKSNKGCCLNFFYSFSHTGVLKKKIDKLYYIRSYLFGQDSWMTQICWSPISGLLPSPLRPTLQNEPWTFFQLVSFLNWWGYR